MYDVITIGSAVRDIFIFSDQFEIIKTPRIEGGIAECVPLGSKIDVDDLFVTTGGGGTNTAATFASLGLRTSCLTRIGDDEDGDLIIEDLQERSIDTSHVVRDTTGDTGLSVLLTAPGGERTILTYRGVSGAFTASDIKTTKLRTRALYVSSLGGDRESIEKIARFAARKNLFFAWNPGKGELRLPKKVLRTILTSVNVLIVNKEEALMLVGSHLPEHMTVGALAEHLRRHDDQIVIVTDGTNGTHAASSEGTVHVGTRDIKSISRAGAGDAFGSGTVAALLSDYPLIDALKIGTFNAESVIQSYGAKQGIIPKFPHANSLRSILSKSL